MFLFNFRAQNVSSFIPKKIKYILFLIRRKKKHPWFFIQIKNQKCFVPSLCLLSTIHLRSLFMITFCYQCHSNLLFFIQHHAPASYRSIYYSHHTIIDKFCQYVCILDTRQTHEWLSAINPLYIRWYHSHNTSSIYSIQSNNSCIYQRPFSFNFIRKGRVHNLFTHAFVVFPPPYIPQFLSLSPVWYASFSDADIRIPEK